MKIIEIRASKPEGKMKQVSGNNNIVFDNGVVFESINSIEKTKLWNKLKKMGFEQHYNLKSDEYDGIAQAGQKGENPFSYSIICANPELNKRIC